MHEYAEQFQVDQARLESGHYNHEAERQEGTGDIHASYSGDTIAEESRIRRPFLFQGEQWICVGNGGRLIEHGHEAYRLADRRAFTRPTYTYREKIKIQRPEDKYAGDFARNDPNGFYDGMIVKSGKAELVMCGPPAAFIPAATTTAQQLSLF